MKFLFHHIWLWWNYTNLLNIIGTIKIKAACLLYHSNERKKKRWTETCLHCSLEVRAANLIKVKSNFSTEKHKNSKSKCFSIILVNLNCCTLQSETSKTQRSKSKESEWSNFNFHTPSRVLCLLLFPRPEFKWDVWLWSCCQVA